MSRNIFAWNDLVIQPLLPQDVDALACDFSCDPDLNDFFKNDSLIYERGLWVKNYKIVLKDREDLILGLASLLNDALRFDKKSQKRRYTNFRKNYMEAHPAMKIGRLAVRKELCGKGVGSKILNLLKIFFLYQNRTGCRFITVDAYDKPEVLSFYEKNGFVRILSEASDDDDPIHTVSLFFPLIELLASKPSDAT